MCKMKNVITRVIVCCYFCSRCLGFELILYGFENDNLELMNRRSGEWGDHVTL
jgi:hypothetical protein